MKDCTEYWDLMSAGLDGALSPEERARLEAHLAQCPECRELFAQLGQMGTDLGGIEQPPAGFADAVMAEAARTEQDIPFTNLPQNRETGKRARERVGQWWKPIRTWGAIAACFLLILGLGRAIGMSGMGRANSSAPAGGAQMTEEGADTAAAEDVAPADTAPAPAAEEPAEPEEMPAEAAPAEDAASTTESASEKPDAGMVLAFPPEAEILSVNRGESGNSRGVELSQEDQAALLELFSGIELTDEAPACDSDLWIEGNCFTLWVHTECGSVLYSGDDGQTYAGELNEEQLERLMELLGE